MEINMQLIKLLLGILVFVAVVGGVYLIFKDNILNFFKNLGGEPEKVGEQVGGIVLSLIK